MGQVLYGECVRSGETTIVRISELASRSCAVETDLPVADMEGDLSLWIGAIGPLAAKATRRDDTNLAVHFVQPLDAQILHHFSRS
ncbi:hypothetical protein [Novosphingobium sp. PhB165]|uniref:hypothetical protein n=1 Tax=Novosphingobium sp. PhB165 TaxID=2485105 RepID=UPI00140466F9|nr:hypothetical protein [Novosphingobium sp. PhB165]